MLLTEGLINDNGISGIALAFFSVLTAAVGTTIVGIFQVKAKATDAKDVALETRTEAKRARENTTSVSNGFTGNVDRKLDRIIEKQISLDNAFREHLEWHLDNTTQKG